MIKGVTEGYKTSASTSCGVGYRADLKGQHADPDALGLSHQVRTWTIPRQVDRPPRSSIIDEGGTKYVRALHLESVRQGSPSVGIAAQASAPTDRRSPTRARAFVTPASRSATKAGKAEASEDEPSKDDFPGPQAAHASPPQEGRPYARSARASACSAARKHIYAQIIDDDDGCDPRRDVSTRTQGGFRRDIDARPRPTPPRRSVKALAEGLHRQAGISRRSSSTATAIIYHGRVRCAGRGRPRGRPGRSEVSMRRSCGSHYRPQ